MVIGSDFGKEAGNCANSALIGIVTDCETRNYDSKEKGRVCVARKMEQVFKNDLIQGGNGIEKVVVSRDCASTENKVGGPIDGLISSKEVGGGENKKSQMARNSMEVSPISRGAHTQADVSLNSPRPNGKVGGRRLEDV